MFFSLRLWRHALGGPLRRLRLAGDLFHARLDQRPGQLELLVRERLLRGVRLKGGRLDELVLEVQVCRGERPRVRLAGIDAPEKFTRLSR
jgi:hypothetical protein